LSIDASFGHSRGLLLLRNENLEAERALRRRIHRLVREDDRRARRDDSFRLSHELRRQPTFLRRQEEALARGVARLLFRTISASGIARNNKL
jgi:hypothetical protein